MRQLLLPIALAGLLVGCGEVSRQSAPSAPQTSQALPSPPPLRSATATPSESSPGTVIKTGDSEFGQILFDGTGQAIYLFDKEDSRRAECYGPCAEAWPPVLTEGTPRPSGDADERLLGTTRRTDGATQVNYGGSALYFYAHEGKNQVLCHKVSQFGGLWLAVTRRGEPAP